MKLKSSIFLSICTSLLVLGGCASRTPSALLADADVEAPGRPGSLLIVGGALKLENAVIYKRMAALGGEPQSVGVLPTASGVPEESGPGTVEDFQHHGVTAALIDVNFRAPQEAANPERAADIRAHRSIWFTGGDQSRIINAFRPDDGDTVGYEALWSVLDADGAIGGTSAGAAMMSDPCIRWGNSAEALLVGFSEVEDRGVRVGKGMGFFPYGITDQHFIRRGRLGRMIMAQVLTDMQFGFGVEENRGLQVDLETHELTAVGGDRAILIADIGEIQTNGLAHEGIRITLLSDGDTMHGLRHTVTVNPLSTRKPLNTTEWNGNQVLHEGQAWEANRLVDLMATMAILGLRTATTSDDNFDLTFTVDERTRFYLAPDTGGPDRADISVVDIRLDITPKAHAAEARQALLIEISSGGMGN